MLPRIKTLFTKSGTSAFDNHVYCVVFPVDSQDIDRTFLSKLPVFTSHIHFDHHDHFDVVRTAAVSADQAKKLIAYTPENPCVHDHHLLMTVSAVEAGVVGQMFNPCVIDTQSIIDLQNPTEAINLLSRIVSTFARHLKYGSHLGRTVSLAVQRTTLALMRQRYKDAEGVQVVNRTFTQDELAGQLPLPAPRGAGEGVLRVTLGESLEAGASLAEQGHHVAVLDFGDEFQRGGFYRSGAYTQEEAICRRSTLVFSIDPRIMGPEFNTLPEIQYPWTYCEGFIAQNIDILRYDVSHDYTLRPQPCPRVNVIVTAAKCNPRCDKEGHLTPAETTFLRHRVRCAVRGAAATGARVLVLGALGCGVFNNPPEDVARVFAEELAPHMPLFDVVEFAMYSPGKNYDAFSKVLAELPPVSAEAAAAVKLGLEKGYIPSVDKLK